MTTTGQLFTLNTAPLSTWNPGCRFTTGAVNVTVAPLSMVTPVPSVIEVVPAHSHVAPDANVVFSIVTSLPEQLGQEDEAGV